MTEDEWYDDLNATEAAAVRRRVTQAAGLVESSLEILDGSGERHRDNLAEAFGHLSNEETAFRGVEKILREQEDE